MLQRSLGLRGWRLALLLLLGSAILRSASLCFGVMDIDEAHWTVIGKLILQGGVPYRDFADHKPPLLFYLYALLSAPGGDLRVTHALMLPWVTVTALLAGVLARRLSGLSAAGAATALAYLVLSSSNLHTASSELLSDLPLVAGLVLLPLGRSEGRWKALPAGLLLGLAALVRPQAGIGLGAAVLALLLTRQAGGYRGRLLAAGLCLGGFLLPLAGTAAAFAAAGELHALLDWTIWRNLSYPPPGRWLHLFLLHSLTYAVPLLWAVLLAAPWLREAGEQILRGRSPQPLLVLAVTLLVLACLGVAQGRRFYAHYYIQLALPLALLVALPLGTPLAARRPRRWVLRVAGFMAITSGIAFATVGWVRGGLGGYPSQEPRAQSVVSWLRSPAAPPGRLLIWGDASHIYLGAGRLPGARFYNTAPLVGNFDAMMVPDDFEVSRFVSGPDVALYQADIRRLRPTILVDTSTGPIHAWDRFPLRRVTPIWQMLQRCFRRAAHTPGGDIYVATGCGLQPSQDG